MKTKGSAASIGQQATSEPTQISEADALQALIAAHNAESKAIIEFIRAHNRAAMEANKARTSAKSAKATKE